MIIKLSSSAKRQVLDITNNIEDHIKGDGLANIFLTHTSAALAFADLDPGTDDDLLSALRLMTPTSSWNHPHDPKHFPDHLWSSLIGASLTLPYAQGRLTLGAWQRITLIELDGPRERRLVLTLIPSDTQK